MNLNHLYYFRALAKVEHYTKAANELSITQPSLSHAISALEKELGTYLFEKQGRNVKLTKYGKFFLEYVDAALSELEIGERKLRDLASVSTGHIDLGFIYQLGSSFIPNLLKEFLKDESNKNITFSFGQGKTKDLLKDLKNEKYDFIFCSHVNDEPDIDFTPLFKQELVVITSKNSPLASLDYIDLKNIQNYPFISFNKQNGLRSTIDNLFSQVNVVPPIKCEVEDELAMAGLVAIDYGIAIVPNISILNNFDVKILKITNPTYERYIYMASLKNKYLTPSVQLLKDFILEKFPKNR